MINSESLKPIAVFMHHPPCEVSLGPNIFHFENLKAMSDLFYPSQRSDWVTSIFCGHVNRSATDEVANIPATFNTAVTTQIRSGHYPKHFTRVPIYNIHRYYEEQGFITETRKARCIS